MNPLAGLIRADRLVVALLMAAAVAVIGGGSVARMLAVPVSEARVWVRSAEADCALVLVGEVAGRRPCQE